MIDSFTITVFGDRFTPIVDSEFHTPDYGARPYSEDVFFARCVRTGAFAVICSDLSDFQRLPDWIDTIELAHKVFAFSAGWYRQGVLEGAHAKQQEFRRILGV